MLRFALFALISLPIVAACSACTDAPEANNDNDEDELPAGEGEDEPPPPGEGEDEPGGEGEDEPPPPPPPDEIFALQLLTFSDWHGQIEPLKVRNNMTMQDELVGGAAALAAYFEEDRLVNPNTLTLTAGDEFGGSPPIASFFDEEPAVKALNLMGVDASTLGNHNFDKGIDHLQQMIDLADYRVVSSNLENIEAELTGVETPYTIFDVDGVQVAVIGITNDDADQLTFPGRLGALDIEDSATAAITARAAAEADGAQVFIALVHMGATGTNAGGAPVGPLLDFANAVSGFHAIVGDHTDIQVNTVVNGAVVVENKSKGRTYARIQLALDPETFATVAHEVEIVTPLVADVTPSTDVDDMLEPYRAQLAAQLDEKIGTATALFDRGNNVERLGEVAIGNLVADSMRVTYGVQVALTNGGGIRDKIPSSYQPQAANLNRAAAPFDVVVGDAFAVLPFGNYVVTKTITGAQLKAALEHGLGALPMAAGKFPQVSGIRVTFDPNLAAGARVTSLTLTDGTPITDATSLTFATTDFVNLGGDGYTMLADGTGSTREIAADVLAAHIRTLNTLTPSTDGRLAATAPPPPPPALSLEPATVSLQANNGATGFVANTGIVTLNLGAAAPAGGQEVAVTSSDPTVFVPATVTVPEGETSVTFRIATNAPVAVQGATISLDGTVAATVNVVTTARAPGAGDLVIGEIAYDPTAANPGTTEIDGDFNCDGVRNGVEDEFVELTNVTADALLLDGVSFWDATAFAGGTPRDTFAGNYVLGPGESLVVFGGGDPLANLDSGAWCGDMFNGDADVLASAGLALDNTGDTLRITAGATAQSTEIASMTYANGAAPGQSLVRAGTSFMPYAQAGGRPDRKASPGTKTDGTTFADLP